MQTWNTSVTKHQYFPGDCGEHGSTSVTIHQRFAGDCGNTSVTIHQHFAEDCGEHAHPFNHCSKFCSSVLFRRLLQKDHEARPVLSWRNDSQDLPVPNSPWQRVQTVQSTESVWHGYGFQEPPTRLPQMIWNVCLIVWWFFLTCGEVWRLKSSCQVANF